MTRRRWKIKKDCKKIWKRKIRFEEDGKNDDNEFGRLEQDRCERD